MTNNLTVKQHYIPQVYLRGFSPEYLRKDKDEIKPSKYSIYCYELEKDRQSNAIPIKSICYEKNLYEVTGSNGEIVLPNHIEKVLGELEKMFSIYRNKLERKAFNEFNYRTGCFLDKDEKVFWLTYIVLQMLRSPKTLSEAEQVSKDTFKENVNDRQAKNIAREFCLPFFKEVDEKTPEARLFTEFVTPMMSMSFVICVDRDGSFITSDKTSYIYCKEFPCNEYEKVIFPITSQLCLILLGGEEKKEYKRKNFLTPVNEETRKMIFSAIMDSAQERIYANHKLSK